MTTENASRQSWIEGRDRWYVDTLVHYAIPAEDILSNNWEGHGISLKVDIVKGVEILCIKGEPIGEPYALHPDTLAQIIYDYNKSKIILPDGTNNN